MVFDSIPNDMSLKPDLYNWKNMSHRKIAFVKNNNTIKPTSDK